MTSAFVQVGRVSGGINFPTINVLVLNLTACIVVWQGAPEDVQPALPLLEEAQESSTPLLCKAANLVAWFKPSICVRTRTEETSSLRDRLT